MSGNSGKEEDSKNFVSTGIPGSYPVPDDILLRYGKGESFCYPEFEPCQQAVDGILYDFNIGVRVQVPDNGYRYRLVLSDTATRCVLHNAEIKPNVCIACQKKYYIKYAIQVYSMEDNSLVWEHTYDASGKDVLVQMPYAGAVGDTIAWFSFCERFQRAHGCRLHVTMPPHMRELFERQYPDIRFLTLEEAKALRPYATYYLGLFFKGDEDWQPYDFRLISLAETAGRILGVTDLSEQPPRLDLSAPRQIEEPYVCIASQASAHAKHWCNPFGWRVLVDWLKRAGYRVLCIDRDTEVGADDVWHSIPYGCEDFTGNRPLQERVDLLKDADFFVGLSSGLSWLAWACRVPVVLISGICMPFGEFQTPYRVQANITCHGCWNDTRYEFDHHDFMWCPRYKGTKRAYECTRAISFEMVRDAIMTIPGAKAPE